MKSNCGQSNNCQLAAQGPFIQFKLLKQASRLHMEQSIDQWDSEKYMLACKALPVKIQKAVQFSVSHSNRFLCLHKFKEK
jgi:hypothetical protein